MPYWCKKCNIEYEQTSRQYQCLECGENTIYGDKCFCPDCNCIRNTTCSACGCGSCCICGHRFMCMPLDFLNWKPIKSIGWLGLDNFKPTLNQIYSGLGITYPPPIDSIGMGLDFKEDYQI